MAAAPGEANNSWKSPDGAAATAPADREEKDDRRNYADYSVWDMIADNEAARTVISREDVVRELASSPMPKVDA